MTRKPAARLRSVVAVLLLLVLGFPSAAFAQRAELTVPPASSTLTSTTITFRWSGGTNVTGYWVYVGTTPGGAQLYNADRGVNLTATVTGLPADGHRIHVRLWSLLNSAWVYNDYSFTTGASTAQRSQLLSPAGASTLMASTVTMTYSGGNNVTRYWPYVGTTVGAYDLYNQDRGVNLSATISGLPTDGRKLYVRLWSLINGTTWEFEDYVWTAAAATSQRAELTSPAPASTVSASTITLQWSGGRNVTQYWPYVGTTPGGADVYNQDRGKNLSATVTGLPTDGRKLYVRLWSLVEGTWEYHDYSLTASTTQPQLAQLTTPPPSSTLSASTVNFSWTGGTRITKYRIDVGTTRGGQDLYSQDRGSNLTATVSGLPTNGQKVYVRLSSLVNGSTWESNDYSFTAAQTYAQRAQLMSPSPGSTLQASTANFSWTGGTNVSRYWPYVGSAPGGSDYYNQDRGGALSATVVGLPTDGRKLYVRLWSLMNGANWEFEDYTMTAAKTQPQRAQLVSPAPSSTLTASTVDFRWNGGTQVTKYWPYVGTSPGGSDIYTKDRGTNLTATVTGLPTDGRKVYVRLWSLINDTTWEYLDYTLTSVKTNPTIVEINPNSIKASGVDQMVRLKVAGLSNGASLRVRLTHPDGSTDLAESQVTKVSDEEVIIPIKGGSKGGDWFAQVFTNSLGSNLFKFFVERHPQPSVTRVSPASAAPGTWVDVFGANLSPSGSYFAPKVHFGSTSVTAEIVSNTQLRVKVPSGSGTVSLLAETTGGKSGTLQFGFRAPTLQSISPTSGARGQQVTLTGEGFGINPGQAWIMFGDSQVAVPSVWEDRRIVLEAPMDYGTGTNDDILKYLAGCALQFSPLRWVIKKLGTCNTLLDTAIARFRLSLKNPGFVERAVQVYVHTSVGNSGSRQYLYTVPLVRQ